MTDQICQTLRAYQRKRVTLMKFRIMLENRLRAAVAIELGYNTAQSEADRKKKFKAADAVIKQIKKGDSTPEYADIVLTSLVAVDGFKAHEKKYEAAMTDEVKKIPIGDWIEHRQQRGFS